MASTSPPSTATHLVFLQQPTATVAGVPIATPVKVKIEDAFGNIEIGDNSSTLTIAIPAGLPGAVTLRAGSTLSATVAGGVATFTTLMRSTRPAVQPAVQRRVARIHESGIQLLCGESECSKLAIERSRPQRRLRG